MFSLTRRLIIGATLGLLALAATPAQAQRFGAGSGGYGSMGYGGGGYGGAQGLASLLGLFMNGGNGMYPSSGKDGTGYSDGYGSPKQGRNERKESRPADKVRNYLYGPAPRDK